MGNTYNYLTTAIRDQKEEFKASPSSFFIALVLLTIPLNYAVNSIALGVYAAITLVLFKKKNFKFDSSLLLPIILFLLMSLSLTWTHSISSTTKALSKGLPLLVIPICFFVSPGLTQKEKTGILQKFSFGMLFFSLYFFLKAIYKFVLTNNKSVFFYHELVTEDLNAIHYSVYLSVAIFYFLTKLNKSTGDKISIVFLIFFLVLLSSKNILLVFLLLSSIYYLKTNTFLTRKKTLQIATFLLFLIAISFFGKIKDRIVIEYKTNIEDNTLNNEIGSPNAKVYNVSVNQAWNQKVFKQNDYFPGAAFRVYQIRIFKEMLSEDPIFFTGYGLNAADFKIEEKSKEYNLYDDYGKKNFHNQYIQFFAELGFFGFVLLLVMVFINLKKGIKAKDFIHIAFAVLMISLFLTESLLSRQRGIVFFTILYCILNSSKEEKMIQRKIA